MAKKESGRGSYPWSECISDQTKRYNAKAAPRICGKIRAASIAKHGMGGTMAGCGCGPSCGCASCKSHHHGPNRGMGQTIALVDRTTSQDKAVWGILLFGLGMWWLFRGAEFKK